MKKKCYGLIGMTVAIFAIFTGCLHSKPATPLTGTVWILQADKLANVQNPQEKPVQKLTLTIAKDGKVHGCAGVNRFSGTATMDPVAHALLFSPLAITLSVGPGLGYEVAYLETLALVQSYEIDGNNLILYAGGQEPILFYRAQ